MRMSHCTRRCPRRDTYMAVLPFSDSQCFFFTILAFAVVGLYRGWKKEILSLLFVLIAAFLVHPSGDQSFAQALARIPTAIVYLLSGQSGGASSGNSSTPSL